MYDPSKTRSDLKSKPIKIERLVTMTITLSNTKQAIASQCKHKQDNPDLCAFTASKTN